LSIIINLLTELYLISNTITLFQSIQVAKSVKVVYSQKLAAVFISLDMGIIKKAGLNIDANIVKESILQTGKLKLKPEVKNTSCNYEFLFYSIYSSNIQTFFLFLQNIKILDIKKLQVEPQGSSRSEILFQLNNLKNLLPSVVVKVCVYTCVCVCVFLDS